jgi:hypothetical protein
MQSEHEAPMPIRSAAVLSAVTALTVACTGADPADSTTQQSVQPPGGQPASPAPPPAACQAPEATSLASFDTIAGVVARLGGTWRNCETGTLPPATLGGAAGFRVESDGHYYPLGFDAAGHVTRLTGFLHEGTVALNAQNYPLILFGSNTEYPLSVMLSADGTTLRTDSIGSESGPFVASDDVIVDVPPEPAGAREGAAGCKTMERDVMGAPATVADANGLVLGSWTLCPDATGAGTTPAGTQGIAFAVDGTWAFLVAASGGAPAPSPDPTMHGTFEWVPSIGSLGGPALQLDLTTVAGGAYYCIVSVSMRPVKLQLDNVGGLMTFSAN